MKINVRHLAYLLHVELWDMVVESLKKEQRYCKWSLTNALNKVFGGLPDPLNSPFRGCYACAVGSAVKFKRGACDCFLKWEGDDPIPCVYGYGKGGTYTHLEYHESSIQNLIELAEQIRDTPYKEGPAIMVEW